MERSVAAASPAKEEMKKSPIGACRIGWVVRAAIAMSAGTLTVWQSGRSLDVLSRAPENVEDCQGLTSSAETDCAAVLVLETIWDAFGLGPNFEQVLDGLPAQSDGSRRVPVSEPDGPEAFFRLWPSRGSRSWWRANLVSVV
jgi:hypothetical protein